MFKFLTNMYEKRFPARGYVPVTDFEDLYNEIPRPLSLVLEQQLQIWMQSGTQREEQRAAAVNRIRQCHHAKEDTIDLSHFNLSEWPPYLPPTVRKIDASHNALQQFPPASLVQIESLDISHNRLMQLPAVYSAPLSRLNISHNALSSLPAPLYESLEHLRVNNNPLNSLDNLSSASLKWLEARNCGLQHFSATTPALTHRDLSENHITSPPPAWPETLQRLKLSHNKLTHLGRLPDSVGQLNADGNQLVELPNPPPKNLHFIDISHNQLRRLFDPEKAVLQVLKADHNLIDTVPAAFSRKECNTRLWLSDNPLTEETKNRLNASNRAISAFDSALPRIVL